MPLPDLVHQATESRSLSPTQPTIWGAQRQKSDPELCKTIPCERTSHAGGYQDFSLYPRSLAVLILRRGGAAGVRSCLPILGLGWEGIDAVPRIPDLIDVPLPAGPDLKLATSQDVVQCED